MPRVLILGGTTEALALAALLDADGVAVTTSLAGRVRTPRVRPGTTRVGGFGGVDGLAAWLAANPVDAVLDVTHPFAAQMSANAAAATARTGTPLLAVRRPGWRAQPGDRWQWADDVDHAAALLPAIGRRALLTTGRQELAAFAGVDAVWFLVRSVERPDPPFPRHHELLQARGPFALDDERALLERHAIDVVVTKDSGGEAATAKLQAARERGLPVLIVRRPAPPPGVAAVGDVASAARWVLARVQ